MAGLISRGILTLGRRSVILSSVRGAQKMMADPLEHATGLERKELEAMIRGNDNPFNMKAVQRGPGTKENPTMVPSFYDARIIGCVCHEDSFHVCYMWLHKGEAQRCECGHHYKLYAAEDPFAFLAKK